VLEIHGTPRKVAGHSADDDDSAISFRRTQRDDRMVIFRSGIPIPLFDRLCTRERLAFVVDQSVGREAAGERAGIPIFVGGEVPSDGLW